MVKVYEIQNKDVLQVNYVSTQIQTAIVKSYRCPAYKIEAEQTSSDTVLFSWLLFDVATGDYVPSNDIEDSIEVNVDGTLVVLNVESGRAVLMLDAPVAGSIVQTVNEGVENSVIELS